MTRFHGTLYDQDSENDGWAVKSQGLLAVCGYDDGMYQPLSEFRSHGASVNLQKEQGPAAEITLLAFAAGSLAVSALRSRP